MKKLLIIYERLSDEDEVEKDESNSITNQRILINNYIQKNNLSQGLKVEEFYDDGYSGKNFHRPGIQTVLDKVKKRMVSILIIKDFSRLSRDYIELGRYIDMIFPFLNVRFISINNQYDSIQYKNRTPGIEVPFQNLVYDFYSEDLSENIKKAFQIKREKGEYFGRMPAYGYLLNKDNKGMLIRDPIAGDIVGKIIRMRIKFKKYEIRNWLNKQGIITPAAYLNQMGYNLTRESPIWTIRMITNIIQNPVHIGVMASGKTERIEVASSTSCYIPRDQWVIKWNMHEPNVPLDIFLEVQKLEGIDTEYLFLPNKSMFVPKDKVIKPKARRTVKTGKYILPPELKESPVKGKVICGGCHHNMYRKWYKNKGIYYLCTYSNTLGIEHCSHGRIYEKEIEQIVLEAINQQCLQVQNIREVIKIGKEATEKELINNEKNIKKINNEMITLKIRKKEVLIDFQIGKISKEEYIKQKAAIIDQFTELSSELNIIQSSHMDIEEKDGQCMELFSQGAPFKVLTKELADQLIEKIEIFNYKKIRVVFKFQDEIELLAKEYLSNN